MSRHTLSIAAISVAATFWACTLPGLSQPNHYPMRGLHQGLNCVDCHPTSLRGAPTACSGCHEDSRPANHYSGDCMGCHSEDGWQFAVVDHTFLSLDGGHAGLVCSDCHDPNDFSTLDAACASCHLDRAPANHFDGGCEDCHVVSSWGNITFEHPWFPVPHRGLTTCGRCHTNSADYTQYTCTNGCHLNAHNQNRGCADAGCHKGGAGGDDD